MGVQPIWQKLLHHILPVVSLVMTHPRGPYPGYQTPMMGIPQATNLGMTGIHSQPTMTGPIKSGYCGAQTQSTPGAPQMHQPITPGWPGMFAPIQSYSAGGLGVDERPLMGYHLGLREGHQEDSPAQVHLWRPGTEKKKF